ncbi:hypothetical protein PG994_007870 [Apiospora phragmitis]|uniref:NAD-dependent epimerase/dehydratase domain-containing protein n=1 Tax=Apiospora phragmitis TaxID=2905665 RepID=A0ABR1UUH7_9PEZI
MSPGYIGGDAFYALYETHADYDYTLLVRNEERGKPVVEKYPKVRLVYGDLSSADVLEKEAAAADVVVRKLCQSSTVVVAIQAGRNNSRPCPDTADSADSMPSALAIGKGLAAGHSAEQPGYYIHLCGTGILMDTARWGEPPLPENTYHDIDGIEQILSLPDSAYHRDVDKVVLAANTADRSVRTLIVSPPCIYGRGRGLGNQRSIQVYSMAEQTLQTGYAPVYGTGLSEWDYVHVRDLSQFFVLAVEAALDPAKRDDPEVFGPRTYYFLESGKLVAGELARWIRDEVNQQDVLAKPAELKTFEQKDAGFASLACNALGVAARAARYLGWKPQANSLRDEIPEVIRSEVARLRGAASRVS